MNDGTLWGLVFSRYPVPRGTEAKIVWRVTGAGDVALWATGPSGRRVGPVWGPEAHTGSTWHRPGDEWGTGWRFPEAGCWTVHLGRGPDQGAVGVRVAG